MGKPQRKERASFTLSPQSLKYLEEMKAKRKAPSVSAVLDEILAESMRSTRRAALESKMTAYYDSVSDAELRESRIWGELAEKDFPE
jgi:hypothetical protein